MRDIFLANIDQLFEAGNMSKKEHNLEQENNKLRQVIGDLTLELKKRLVKFQRKSSLRRENLDAPLVETIKELKSLHPFWGYRRIWAFLQYKNKIIVNHKRVYRLMKKHNLGVMRAALKACRTPQKSKPKATVSCQWWGIDMTKIITKMGWIYVTVVLDWYSKKIVGYHIGYQKKTLIGFLLWIWHCKPISFME